jgi:hypothetical protein
MARIVVGSTLVRYPLGGMSSWILSWLLGFSRLGHDVYFVEKSGWANACYDVARGIMTDDCSYGVQCTNKLLGRYGLQNNWCFIDSEGRYHGITAGQVEKIFKSTDVFVDLEWDEWFDEASEAGLRVFVDGEPGWFQMILEHKIRSGEELPSYDYHFTMGRNIGTSASPVPTAGIHWRPLFNPVLTDIFCYEPVHSDAPFTTVMQWRAHRQLEFDGVIYGQKDVEFEKFMDLPARIEAPMEIAVSGHDVPRQRLMDAGWHVRNADQVAVDVDSYRSYIVASRGEFSVAKNVFVATNNGCFMDRGGHYLATGRPVVQQDTGFSSHLPCGEGLFAVRTVEEAIGAMEEINSSFERHSRRAREIAVEFLSAEKVLSDFLLEIGL